MIVTPNVVREVQSHFGCSEMIGGELESQTVLQSAAGDSFWEKRVFGEEVMTASASYYPILSRLTLALLHDSGWYTPDYSYGASLHWGRGQGCGFLDGSCYKWVWPTETKYGEDTSVVPFCRHQQDSAESCVNGRRAVGVCSIRNYPARLPRPFRYFSTRRRGGASPMVDYCPIFLYDFASYQPTGRSCLTPPSTLPTLPVPEVYEPESRCFEHQWEGRAREGVVGGASCHTFSCTRDSVVVDVGGSKVDCSHGLAGEHVAVEFTRNSTGNNTSVHIVCPSYQDLCENYNCPRLCSGHGNCIKGHCRCQPGYYGNDCSYSYLDRLLTCDSVLCQNGGSCTDSGGSGSGGGVFSGDDSGGGGLGFSCQCSVGYTGMMCENRVTSDPCLDLSCPANTHCVRSDLGTVGQCECKADYGGEDCKTFLLCERRGATLS
ncbi:Leishmanolysin-like peptidase [Geodia barretti]|uniref:Leishmanolysin-like peptidase n=1 Tax=Geodia barretti TaxID=519541 RepID=A0AA35W2Q0_GEOBA|nr:Leishmanolysin-like peptidase [Geodia barretti]